MPDEIDSITTPPAEASPIAPGTLDRAGVPFDRARHVAKKHPKTGRWMPRGGRKPASASSGSTSSPQATTEATQAGAHSSPSSPSPTVSPAVSVTVDDLIPITAAPKPTAPSGDVKPTPAAPDVGPTKPEAAPAAGDNVEMQADTLWKGLYAIAGVVTGAPEEAVRTGPAHASNVSVMAAWMRESGFRLKGIWGLLLVIAVWIAETITKVKTSEFVRRWRERLFKKKPTAQTVPEAAPAKTEPAPAAPAPTHDRYRFDS